MNEIWKDVSGYEEFFQISNHGRFYQKRSKRILKTSLSNGYNSISTQVNGNRVYFKIHRVVAETFIPNPENKEFVNHIDCDKKHNHVKNLEWMTCSENTQHAYDNGLLVPKRGCEHNNSKFDKKQLCFIKENYGKISVRKMAKMLDCGSTTVYNAYHGLTYC